MIQLDSGHETTTVPPNKLFRIVKFNITFLSTDVLHDPRLEELKYWGRQFQEHGFTPSYLIGTMGNLSFRVEDTSDQFIITGSKIRSKADMTDECFVKVHSCDLDQKNIEASGPIKPSSESMMHYLVYSSRNDINAVFHGHSKLILKNAEHLNLPQTASKETHGSMELVNTVREILDHNNFIVLKGHGFLSLGITMKDAGELAIRIYKSCKN